MPVIEKKGPSTLPPAMEALTDLVAAGAPTLDVEELTQEQQTETVNAPALSPPAEIAEAVETAAAEGIAAWHNAVKVSALWVNSSQRNAWVALQGLGWRRVAAVNDSSFLAITAMLSHARQMNVSCNVRIDSDNQIHEAYVW